MLTEIGANRRAIENEGAKIVLVHMESTEEAQPYLNLYNLQHIDHISDPDFHTYDISD